jgi:hypothetical protein
MVGNTSTFDRYASYYNPGSLVGIHHCCLIYSAGHCFVSIETCPNCFFKSYFNFGIYEQICDKTRFFSYTVYVDLANFTCWVFISFSCLFSVFLNLFRVEVCGPGSSVGIETGYELDGLEIESRWGEIFRTCPDRPWGPPSLLYNGYRVFPGSKTRLGRDADLSPPSSAEV